MFRRDVAEYSLGATLRRGVNQRPRAIGEFGAVSVVSGSIRGETLMLPLQIELLSRTTTPSAPFTAAAY